MEALLIMDADVIYRPDSLRRMTRHLADEKVGAVTAFIREGSGRPGSVARFIGYEYVTAQAAARRAQNVMGAMACLAGGAQLHSRANLEAVGGQVDTSHARRGHVHDVPHAAGRAPRGVRAGRGGARRGAGHRSRRCGSSGCAGPAGTCRSRATFRKVWFRPSRAHHLGNLDFGVIWFAIYLLPVAMTLAAVGLVGLYFAAERHGGARCSRASGGSRSIAYVFITATTLLLDRETARRSWFQGLCSPGSGALVVMSAAWFPDLWEVRIPRPARAGDERARPRRSGR